MNRSTPFRYLACTSIALATLSMACSAVAEDDAALLTEDAVRAASVQYLQALRSGDVETLRSFWTEEGVYVDASGASFNARDMIEQEFAGDAEPVDDPAEADSINSTIRVLPVGAALQEGVVDAEDAQGCVHFTAQWVLQQQQWRLDYLRETRPSDAPAETRLDDLDWLIGDWKAATETGLTATMNVRRSESKKFLLRTITATLEDGSPLKVEQRIGWDPKNKTIRSWAFRTDGGFGEAKWTRHGAAWTVESTETLADGETSKSTRIWILEGSDTLWFKLHNGAVGERAVDDLTLQFTRDTSTR